MCFSNISPEEVKQNSGGSFLFYFADSTIAVALTVAMFLSSVALPYLAIKKAQCPVKSGFKVSSELIFRISIYHAIWRHTTKKKKVTETLIFFNPIKIYKILTKCVLVFTS